MHCELSIQRQTGKRRHLSVSTFSGCFAWLGSESLTARDGGAGAAGLSLPPDAAAFLLGVGAAASETSKSAENLACTCLFYPPDWKLTQGDKNKEPLQIQVL